MPPRFLTKAGEVLDAAEEERDQARNREDALEKFAALLREAFKRRKRRIPTRPSKSALKRRRKSREKQKQKKAERRQTFD